jgi:hypothetical protein
MSSDPKFENEKFEYGNAYMISGIPIASGVPVNGQSLVYNATNKQWEYTPTPVVAGVAGIPIQAGVPMNGQKLQYNQAANEWQFV